MIQNPTGANHSVDNRLANQPAQSRVRHRRVCSQCHQEIQRGDTLRQEIFENSEHEPDRRGSGTVRDNHDYSSTVNSLFSQSSSNEFSYFVFTKTTV
jgi:hypothetical protein